MKRIAIFSTIFMIFISINPFPGKIAKFSDIYRPSMMDIFKDELYILDDFSIKVYSLKDFRFLREFGGKGEGPGELKTTRDTGFSMAIKGNKILLYSVYKLIVYDRMGKIIKEKSFRDYLIEASPIDENYVLTFQKWIDATAYAITRLYDKNFREKKELYRIKLLSSYRTKKVSIPPLYTYTRTSKDKIFLFDQQEDVIRAYNKKGEFESDIAFKYDKAITTQNFKDKIMELLLLNPAIKKAPERTRKEYLKKVYTPNILPVFRNSWIIDNQVYIHTYREKQDKSEFLILDFSGKVERKLFLPGSNKLNLRINPASTFTFYEGKYYYLLENLDQEKWELHVIQLKKVNKTTF